ncbi:hypothetical protein J7382_16040 [Shimia sp. R11_0]|nr:hypothetical protein [Shimia sp. R11_0]MBO9479060.1 hypothetical protein [Shimia sp. R11_0]
MRKPSHTSVFGHALPAQRWTKASAVLVATLLSVPVFVVLTAIDWLFL